MNINQNNIDKFIEEWIDYKEEDLSVLNFEDKKHLISFDSHMNKILKNVSNTNKKYVKNQLFELDNEFSNYTNYWNRKYYKKGFKDAISLILFGLSDN